MNNEGNTNINQTNTSEQPYLKPMEGVRIAPVDEKPVNASNPVSATASVGSLQNTTPNPTVNATPQVVPQQNVAATTPVVETPPPTPIPVENNPGVKQKKKSKLSLLLLLIILVMGGYIYYSNKNMQMEIERLNYECTPITASQKEVELDLDSTLVKSLYSKVSTSIREDMAQPEFNDNMRIYLAYRQILDKDKYESNCNLFSSVSMEPYICEVSTEFVPIAFKEESLKRAIKELFGEKTEIPLQNVRLGVNSCIGGFQYIPERGEFVQGYCKEISASIYSKKASLVKATSNGNTIVLKEDVKYVEGEKLSLPESLKSGYYYYTFRLDMNYNYVLISKTYESKY